MKYITPKNNYYQFVFQSDISFGHVKQGGQSRDTHVVISHVLFSFFRSIQGMFHNYFPAF